MSKQNRKIISEKIVDSMMTGLDLRRDPWPWYKKLLYKFKWKYEDVEYWFRKKYQTWKYGFPCEESWSFLNWHAKVVLPRLRHRRDNLHGAPTEMYPDDYPMDKEWEMDDDVVALAFDNAHCKWEETIDKIIWSFEHLNDIVDPVYPDDYDHRYKMTEYSDGSTSFKSMDERKPSYAPVEEHSNRIQEGLQLFAKHYRNLWI